MLFFLEIFRIWPSSSLPKKTQVYGWTSQQFGTEGDFRSWLDVNSRGPGPWDATKESFHGTGKPDEGAKARCQDVVEAR